MTSISNNVYIDKLDDRTIKMKPVDVTWSAYIDFGVENNKKDSKLKVGGHVRISKYKTIFAIGTLQIGLKKFFWLKKLKMLFHWQMLLLILTMKNFLGGFMKNNSKRQIKKSLELKM